MIYLSICIPTYNRSIYLADTINSIVYQTEFVDSDEVEIVVSDNCSTDDTEEVMQKFLSKYPAKIKYNRNAENIVDRNYEKVLSLASGAMLKLNNDTLILDPGCLGFLLKIIKNCYENNLVPFFLNGQKPGLREPVLCITASQFLTTTSYYCTWIGGFCIPRKSFHKLNNYSKEAALLLVQVDVLMRLLKSEHQLLVIPDKFSTSISPAKKGGYNLPQIFLTNYFEILGIYLINKEEVEALKKEKKQILYKFFLPWLIKIKIDANKDNFIFDITNYQKIIKREFSIYQLIYFELYLRLKIKLKRLKSLTK
jgi:abequosyltransferase